MLRIKRLYTFVLQTFFPVFIMTFGICLFILLMQFLWKYVEDLVGKGLDNIVIGELFLYATLSLIPLALPLSILLASLMTFGNMGEQLELLAIKASGVSLLKAMRPLILFISCVCIGAFFFQNEAMPRINVKFRVLLSSIKHKSPELEIPEGAFYSGIKNHSIYVKKKDPVTKVLHNVMIYDTKEFNKQSVFVCDSARMRVSTNKDFLLLNLYHGQRFANFREADINNNTNRYGNNNKFVPYSRENFKEKIIIIPFEGAFERMDESAMDNHQGGKNITMLKHSIDSMSIKLDSLNTADRQIMKQAYLSIQTANLNAQDSTQVKNNPILKLDFDSVINSFAEDKLGSIYDYALSDSESNSNSYMYRSIDKIQLQKNVRYHYVEWHQKFTLSFACLIFFFIGAPLGAIIRKGGLGMPVVVSVLFFIIYYIFNNVGVKMARDGVWEIWQGMWLSSFVLFPVGVFLTYKAMNDSALFNAEVYGKWFRKILRLSNKTHYNEETSVDESKIPDLSTLNADKTLIDSLEGVSTEALKDIAKNHQQYGYKEDTLQIVLSILKERKVNFFDIRIKNLDYNQAQQMYKDCLRNFKIALILYVLVITFEIMGRLFDSSIIEIFTIITPITYLIFYIKSIVSYSDFYKCIERKSKGNSWVISLLGFIFLWGMYPYLKKQMKEDMNNITW